MERIELTAVMKSDVGAVWPDPDSRVSLSGVAGGATLRKSLSACRRESGEVSAFSNLGSFGRGETLNYHKRGCFPMVGIRA